MVVPRFTTRGVASLKFIVRPCGNIFGALINANNPKKVHLLTGLTQMTRQNAASHQGLYCLPPYTLLLMIDDVN